MIYPPIFFYILIDETSFISLSYFSYTILKYIPILLMKKNKEAVHHIGTAILKRAKFDFSSFSKEDLDDIVKMTPRGSEIIRDIITKAHQN